MPVGNCPTGPRIWRALPFGHVGMIAQKWLLPYDDAMGPSQTREQVSDPSIQAFLAQPAYHADDDASPEPLVPLHSDAATGSVGRRARTHCVHFTFEKKPSPYSSIVASSPMRWVKRDLDVHLLPVDDRDRGVFRRAGTNTIRPTLSPPPPPALPPFFRKRVPRSSDISMDDISGPAIRGAMFLSSSAPSGPRTSSRRYTTAIWTS